MASGYDYSGVYDALSDDALRVLNSLGIDSADANTISGLSFEGVISQLSAIAAKSFSSPLKGLITVTAVIILCAMLTAYRNSLSGDISETVQTAAALCVGCAVAVPAVSFISSAGNVIACCANLFLAYIPVAAVMMAASGRALGAAAYQGSMIAAGQGVARVSADIILPLTRVFLGVAVTSGISPRVRLNGFLALVTKLTRWVLAFIMTVFTSVLSVRQIVSGSLDSLAVRTARFTLSSFVPVVGSALSEAYKSVQGSLHVLKSGLGIFVILALAVTFLPPVLESAAWALCLSAGKAFAEMMGLDGCSRLLEALGMVFSTMLAVLLCVMSALIIASAAAFAIGSDTA